MSVAPITEKSIATGDQAGASNIVNSAIFLSDISRTSINPTVRGDVPQWLPAEQTLLQRSDLSSQPAETLATSSQPTIISSTYLQGLQSSLYGSAGDSSSTYSGRSFSSTGLLRGSLRGDKDEEEDDDGDEDNGGGGGGGGGGLGFLGRIFGRFLGMFGLFRGLAGLRGGGCGGGGCSGGDCSQMMAPRNRISDQALYSSPGMPFWALTPGYGSNKSA